MKTRPGVAPVTRAAALILSCAWLLGAQTPVEEVVIRTHPYAPPSTILRAESNLVEADLTVRDATGHSIGGLQASDFEVFDNGRPQTITAFSELKTDAKAAAGPPPAPKFVTFFFDDLHMGQLDLPFVKQAARAFATKYLKPEDRMSIMTTSGAGDLDFTGDAKLFAEKSDRLTLHTHVVLSLEDYQADSLNTLAALGAAAKRLAAAPGTRILVWMSSGFIIHIGNGNDVEPDVQRLIDAAVHWNVEVHAIDAKGLYPPGTNSALRRPLREISQGTGGHLFENTNDFTSSMELAAKPEVTYLLAFNPGGRDGKFHTLKIRFKSKRGELLEFRPGYFSRKDDESEKRLAARAPMDEAVFSKQTLQGVPTAVTLTGGQPKDGAIPVSIGITVDVNGLQFTSSHGRHMQQIVFLMTLLDGSGGYVTGKESIMDLALTDTKLAALKKGGLRAVATLDAAPGTYQVRTVVREGMKGSLAASTTAVELRAK
jgi:VWFA-related protein